jgi:hypothetical protein
MAPATLRGTADEVTRRPAGSSTAVVSSLTVCPPAGTSSRTVIEYDTEGRRLSRRHPSHRRGDRGGGRLAVEEPAEAEPGVDDGVGVQRHGLDPLLHQPLDQVGVVGRALAADADILAAGLAGLDGGGEHELDGWVAFVEAGGDQRGVAVQTEVSWVMSLEPIENPSK